MSQYTEFGKQVKMKMIMLNLNNRQMAKMLGYTESTLCDILKGRNQNSRRMTEIEEFLVRLQTGATQSTVY